MKVKWTKEKQEALDRTMKALKKVREAVRTKVSGAHKKPFDTGSHAENQSA